MKSETYEDLKNRSYDYLSLSRFPGTKEHKEAKEILKSLLREKNIPFMEEPFFVRKHIPIGARLEVGDSYIE
ncbi:hypothetical protein, partial [Thermocrinis sp.]